MKIKTCFFIVILSILSCNRENKDKSRTKNESFKNTNIKMKENNIIYSSVDVNKFFKINNETNQVELIKNSLVPEKFIAKNIEVNIKENDFEVKPEIDINYYKIKSLKLNDKIIFDIIMYEIIGDNNTNIINIQLNSYDFFRNPIDKILLDCRLTFESEYHREFKLFKNNTIVIKKIAKDWLLYNESGDIIGESDKPKITSQEVKYIVDEKGKFIKSE